MSPSQLSSSSNHAPHLPLQICLGGIKTTLTTQRVYGLENSMLILRDTERQSKCEEEGESGENTDKTGSSQQHFEKK